MPVCSTNPGWESQRALCWLPAVPTAPGLSVPALPTPAGTWTRRSLRAEGGLTPSRLGKYSSETSTSEPDVLHVPTSCTGSALDSKPWDQR